MFFHLRTHRQDDEIKKIIEALNFSFKDFTLEGFVAHLEKCLNRSIHLVPVSMPPGCFGAWVSDRDLAVEYVFYNKSLSLLHREHVQLHELAHIVLGHQTLKVGSQELNLLARSEDNDPIAGVLYRSQTRSDLEEREAEEFAVFIQARRAAVFQALPALPSSSLEGREYLRLFLKEIES